MLGAWDTLKADVVLGLYAVIAKVKEAKHLSHLSTGDYSWLSFPEVCACAESFSTKTRAVW